MRQAVACVQGPCLGTQDSHSADTTSSKTSHTHTTHTTHTTLSLFLSLCLSLSLFQIPLQARPLRGSRPRSSRVHRLWHRTCAPTTRKRTHEEEPDLPHEHACAFCKISGATITHKDEALRSLRKKPLHSLCGPTCRPAARSGRLWCCQPSRTLILYQARVDASLLRDLYLPLLTVRAIRSPDIRCA